MTRRRGVGAVAVAAVVLVASFAVRADGGSAADEARQFIATMADEVIDSLTGERLSISERETRFRRVMTQYFAIDGIARWVVGRAAWQRASDTERREFVDVFQALIVETYAHRFSEYQGETLEIQKALVHDNGDVLVRSRIRRPAANTPLDVDWRVRIGGDGRYRVIDIIVEGLSMAQKQRSEFDSFLRQHDRDLSALIGELRRRIEDAVAQRGDRKG